jgi:hypothetical protein
MTKADQSLSQFPEIVDFTIEYDVVPVSNAERLVSPSIEVYYSEPTMAKSDLIVYKLYLAMVGPSMKHGI